MFLQQQEANSTGDVKIEVKIQFLFFFWPSPFYPSLFQFGLTSVIGYVVTYNLLSLQSEPNVAAMIALIQKLHLCINQLEQVNDSTV